ncbi:MAG TPA: phospholipase D family protein [Burkholderiales bacterium]|nr:phospholipase D family protein [Burkholderiales bacterium]
MRSAAAVRALCLAPRLALPLSLLVALAPAGAQLAAPPALPFSACGTVQVAFAPWEDAEGLVVRPIGEAQRQILVQAFSFTRQRIAQALIGARRRGVEVLVTADREQAVPGIPVWRETRHAAAHSKVMIIDAGTRDSAVITGSFNWTAGAQRRNAQNVLVLRRNRELASAYEANWRHQAQASPCAGSRK